MPIQIDELRLALAWGKAFDKDTFLPYLANNSRYKEEFDRAKSGTGPWLLPWTPGERQHFWQFYLGTPVVGDLQNVDADLAWSRLMPLRAKRALRVHTDPDVRITLEGYAFPHGVGVLGLMFIEPQAALSLSDMVDRAIQARRTQYSVTWDGPPSRPDHGSLDNLADKVIDLMHQELLGQTPHGKPLTEPISTATVVDAVVNQPTAQDSDDLDDALESLCTYTYPATGKYRKHESAGLLHVLAIERGRAVWNPEHFEVATRPRVRAMGCYHRNLALASLQTRSLTGLLRRAEGFLPDAYVSPVLVRPARNAVKLLRDLHDGAPSTYQSWALAEQIGHYSDLIDKISAAVGTQW